MFSLSLAVLFNQLYMYSMYPSAVVGGSYVLYCTVLGYWDIKTYIISL